MISNNSPTLPERQLSDQQPPELPVEKLLRACDPNDLSFQTTDELPDLQEVIGQPRAFRALDLGMDVDEVGYNVFVLGVPDSGRTTLTRDYLQRKAALRPVPDDWCYVNNFENPRQPRSLRLSAGQGTELRKDMQKLIEECTRNLPRAFSSAEYSSERDQLINKMKEEQENELKELEEYVEQYGFVLVRTPYGLFLGPGMHGKPLTPEEIEKLSSENKERLHQLKDKLQRSMEKTIERLRGLEQSTFEELKQLDLRTILFIIRPLINHLKQRYGRWQTILSYLDQVEADLADNGSRFMPEAKTEPNPIEAKEWVARYEVNILVNNAGLTCAPVIIENQPTYHNLIGTIEHEVVFGASYTNFTQIRAGAMHRANGGYLILPARDVLLNPYAWEGLKRVLRDGAIRVLELGSQMGLVSPTTLEPEPIPLNIKVILVGTPALYYLLRAYDEDFAKLFKIRAEFATEMKRTQQSEQEYARFIKSVIDAEHLLPFDRTGVATIIEHGSRMVANQDKLSTQFGIIADLVCESAYWAKKADQTVVDSSDVQKALNERVYRSNLVEERIQEFIQEDTLILDVTGRTAGQINALAVSSLGDYLFGRPNRISASVYAGQAGVIDIERQSQLGGPIHTKGVLILSGFLGRRFGQNRPLNLTASLTFEQSYDEVEGDSASVAELLALLSAISAIPIDQGRAVTGSINQHGQIQAVGGVNQKIEGFFDICHQKGLTGQQGVIIPCANQKNLMLKKEVRDAVKQGLFHIWAVQTVDEAILLVTGCPAGEQQKDGCFPAGTFNHAVSSKLEELFRVVERTSGERKKRKGQQPESTAASA